MKRTMLAAAVVVAGLVPSTADAAIPQVFTKTASPVNCMVQASGQRFCGTSTAQIPSFDGIPLDVSVAFPPAPTDGSPDGPYPVIGMFHGWGGSKLALTGADVQRNVTRGYAVFTMTDRGWGGSCGRTLATDPRCAGKGYIRLMHNAYEVRDAQYALGQLADDGLIDPQKIGATGGSYGGGMSIALGALKNRTQLPDGSLVPWTSPLGKPLQIAATVPEYTWSDLATALNPNGSSLDYVANAPYLGGGHRVGIQKQAWNATLYVAGQLLGLLRPGRNRPVRRPHRLEDPDRQRRAVRRQPRGGGHGHRAHHEPLGALHRRQHPARAGPAGQRLERRPVPGRRVAALLQQGPREVPEHADLDVPPRLRPQPARRQHLHRRPRRARRHRERVDGLLRQGRRLRARRRARRRRHPHLQVPGQRRRHPLPRPDLGAARARRGARRLRPPRRRSPPPAPRRRTRSPAATSARPPRAPTTPPPPPTRRRRRRRRTRSRARRRSSPRSPPRAPTTWSPRACTTSTARRSA